MTCTNLRPLLLCLLTMCCPTARGIEILAYNFTGLAPSTLDANASASNVNFTGSSASQFTLAGVLAVNAAIGATDAATAVSNASFFQFSITPNSGYLMDLTELTVLGSSGTVSLPNNGYVVRSSVDGFSTDLASGAFQTSFPTYTTISVDLSGSEFQNLTAQTTFRIYTWRDAGTNPAAAYDNLVLNGSIVPIPEPGTMALGIAAVGMLIVTAISRRRRPDRKLGQ